jgi:hypothetical protein
MSAGRRQAANLVQGGQGVRAAQHGAQPRCCAPRQLGGGAAGDPAPRAGLRRHGGLQRSAILRGSGQQNSSAASVLSYLCRPLRRSPQWLPMLLPAEAHGAQGKPCPAAELQHCSCPADRHLRLSAGSSRVQQHANLPVRRQTSTAVSGAATSRTSKAAGDSTVVVDTIVNDVQ